ncbi:MATE family efflux transporter [Ohessyouella blattaphilus]|uniref:MATE family efflux transporter n=1 Tax=Ohessyouella blattaphilus TaxID=2949333 RepID=A0ABT1EDN2_9FIRM|nr:MATE family efflux transporter [Ohessyouella blattaphilus]MCP1108798.1 MATE family efflux transporter [Ohessyouella blattaphilus]MCR8562192.1 MATE family efflux transporter [Ohessyouella blattaphilus]
MRKSVDLLQGNILKSLVQLSLPIMLTSFIQMAYNMIDMIWLGRVGSGAVTSVGTAGMYLWFAGGVASLSRIGTQVKLGHALGEDKPDAARTYIAVGLRLAFISGLLYGAVCVLFAKPLIGFFHLSNPETIRNAILYQYITCALIVAQFLNQVFAGVMTAMGRSLNMLLATATGLIINIVLDPLLIFGIGPFPKMGVVGAAIATVLAQVVVLFIFIFLARGNKEMFSFQAIFKRQDRNYQREIIRIGLPTALQNIFFTSIGMIIARLVTSFGDHAIAIQKVGSQIESISWMIIEGFGTAINAFMAQNYGAGNTKRIRKGYHTALGIAVCWGIFCTALLVGLPGPLFSFFLPEKELLSLGIDYLVILGFSQIFMCIELSVAGMFSGLGKTKPPSVVSIVFNALRIPLALILVRTPLGLNGIWWAITISSFIKGIVLWIWFQISYKNINKAPKS